MRLNNNEIKIKAWEKISQYIDSDDNDFNNSACSFRIAKNYNLAVWCETCYEEEEEPRCFVVSIRYNTDDDLFGRDIAMDYCTKNTNRYELDKAIDYLLNEFEKNTNGFNKYFLPYQ